MMFQKKKKLKSLDTEALDKSVLLSRKIKEKSSKALSQFEDLASQAFDGAVVIVEDNADDLEAQKKHFKSNGIRYCFADDCNQAYQLISLIRPDIVILDASVRDFEKMIEDFGPKIVIFSGAPDMVPQRLLDRVKAVFNKTDILDMVEFVKASFHESIDKPEEFI